MGKQDFHIEFSSELEDEDFEADLMAQAEGRLRELASGHDDLIGAAVTLKVPARAETPSLYAATVVAYVRPENVAATEKADVPNAALKGALDAVEKQVRQKREKLSERWERPEQDPVTQEALEVAAAQNVDEAVADVDDVLDEGE